MDITRDVVLSMLFYFGYSTIKENKLGLNVSFNIDVAAFKIPSMGAKYQAIIEVKYIKKEEAKTRKAKEQMIAKKREEATQQINAYSGDKRLPQENMKKFIVIYVGKKLEVLEEIC